MVGKKKWDFKKCDIPAGFTPADHVINASFKMKMKMKMKW